MPLSDIPIELILTVVATVAGLVAGAYKLGSVRGFRRAKRSLSNRTLRRRFENVYAPMASLFITRHVTSGSATLAPYMRTRLGHAWVELRRGRFRKTWLALGDKRKTKETAEIEFGGAFPLKEIKRLVEENAADVDEALLGLVARADRSRYEAMEFGSREFTNELTDEEFELFRHVIRSRETLSEILVADESQESSHRSTDS